MRSMLNFVREGRRKRMSDKELLDSVLKHRWSVHVLKKGRLCLNESEIHRVIVKAAQDLDLVIGFNGWVPEGDLRLGGKLLLMVTICPPHLIEAAKLSVLFEALINYFSLDTLITATINSVQPRAGGSIKDFTSSNMHLSFTRTVILPCWSAPYLRDLVLNLAFLQAFISSPLLGVSW